MKINRNEPLPSHTKWKMDECYAKVVLENFFPERYSDLKIADKPDLRDEKRRVGIEVTSSIPQKERELSRLWSQTVCMEESQKKARNIERMEQLNMHYTGGVQVWPAKTYRTDVIGERPSGDFLIAVDEKIKKLNGGQYEDQSRYDLFVHSEIYVWPDQLGVWMQKLLEELLDKNQQPRRYVYVYLLGLRALHIWNLEDKSFVVIPRDKDFWKYEWTARELVIEREEREEDEQT